MWLFGNTSEKQRNEMMKNMTEMLENDVCEGRDYLSLVDLFNMYKKKVPNSNVSLKWMHPNEPIKNYYGIPIFTNKSFPPISSLELSNAIEESISKGIYKIEVKIFFFF